VLLDGLHEPRKGTVLHSAARFGHSAVVQRLLQGRAHPDTADGKGEAALHTACALGLDDTIVALLHGRASINVANARGCTPLHLVASKGRPSAIHLLLAHPMASLGAVDHRGRTPLDLAELHQHTAAIRVLQDAGAPASLAPWASDASPHGASAKHLSSVGSPDSPSSAYPSPVSPVSPVSPMILLANHGPPPSPEEARVQVAEELQRRMAEHRKQKSEFLQRVNGGAMAGSRGGSEASTTAHELLHNLQEMRQQLSHVVDDLAEEETGSLPHGAQLLSSTPGSTDACSNVAPKRSTIASNSGLDLNLIGFGK